MIKKKRGRPTEEKKDEVIRVRISKSEKENLKKFCEVNNIPDISTLVRLSINEYMNKR